MLPAFISLINVNAIICHQVHAQSVACAMPREFSQSWTYSRHVQSYIYWFSPLPLPFLIHFSPAAPLFCFTLTDLIYESRSICARKPPPSERLTASVSRLLELLPAFGSRIGLSLHSACSLFTLTGERARRTKRRRVHSSGPIQKCGSPFTSRLLFLFAGVSEFTHC